MRRSPLRPKPPPDHRDEPGYWEWKALTWGECAVCGERGQLERHHVVSEQHVRREGGDPYALANSMLLGLFCRCHSRHTNAAERLPASAITAQNLAFMVSLLGEDRTAGYIARYYRVV